jgi:hypothetical protein
MSDVRVEKFGEYRKIQAGICSVLFHSPPVFGCHNLHGENCGPMAFRGLVAELVRWVARCVIRSNVNVEALDVLERCYYQDFAQP